MVGKREGNVPRVRHTTGVFDRIDKFPCAFRGLAVILKGKHGVERGVVERALDVLVVQPGIDGEHVGRVGGEIVDFDHAMVIDVWRAVEPGERAAEGRAVEIDSV